MKMDLAAAAAANTKASTGPVRATWTGGKIEIAEVKFLDLVARALAIAMGRNLHEGRRPDGSGPMPAREYDGKPRGTGAKIALALVPRKNGPLSWFIAAHFEKIGHLARLMKDVPFMAPPIEKIRDAVHNAFLAAVTLSEQIVAGKALPAAVRGPAGDTARAARRQQRQVVRQHREVFATTLEPLGVKWKSGLSKRIRSASRAQIRLRAR